MDFIFFQKTQNKAIPVGESYVLRGLQPNTEYTLWLAAKSQRGEGAATGPISVITEQDSESFILLRSRLSGYFTQ